MQISIPIEIISSYTMDNDPEEFLASIPCMPGMVATGSTQAEAREELIKSLAVKLAYDYGIYGQKNAVPNAGNFHIILDIR